MSFVLARSQLFRSRSSLHANGPQWDYTIYVVIATYAGAIQDKWHSDTVYLAPKSFQATPETSIK